MIPDEKQRCAIVWDAIERLAFMPTNTHIHTWLSLYHRTLHDLWSLQPMDVTFRRHSGFDVNFLNIACNYHVENTCKYSGTIHNLMHNSAVIWMIEVDPNYINRAALHNSTINYPTSGNKSKRVEELRKDVTAVLDGMIFHPTHHCHLESIGVQTSIEETNEIGIHDVRIGSGISNAFVFLFHLRYQFCITSDEIRKSERERLIDLFTTAISKKQFDPIKARDLFNFRH